jgi:hypothetical protein
MGGGASHWANLLMVKQCSAREPPEESCFGFSTAIGDFLFFGAAIHPTSSPPFHLLPWIIVDRHE